MEYFKLLTLLDFNYRRFIKFLVIGTVNTMFGYSIYAIFLFLHFHYSIAALFSTILGVLFNFKTTGRFVFYNRNNKLIMRFITVYIVTYFVNIAALGTLNYLAVDLYTAGFVMLFPMALISYTLNRKFVFKEVTS